MAADIYQALDSSNGEIRLLHLCSSSGAAQRWELVTGTLQSCPPFTALSYLWGDDVKNESVTVNDQHIPITSNLACALHHAAQHWGGEFPARMDADFYFWTDAVCINQGDTREREQQVKLMGQLYATAELVIASLGPLNEAIELSIDTLHRVRDEIKDIPANASMDENISWLQKHPDLIDADVGLLEDQFDANKRWKLLRQFLYLEYWHRAWVLQELVLAQRLLIISESKSLDPDALFAVLKWVQSTKDIARNRVLVRPDWLITSVWNFLTYDNLLGWKSVLRISDARESDKNDRLLRVNLACAGNDLRATDPRDLVYGTMALTKMGFDPDYSPTSQLSTLYARFMQWWLEEVTLLQTKDDNWAYNHLDLLGEAGIGQVADGDDENKDLARIVPSWVPNFSLGTKVYTPHLLLSPRTADSKVFPSDAPLPRADGLSLFVPAISLDTIVKIDKMNDIKNGRGLFDFVAAYCSRHAQYPTGCASLQGLFRTLMKDVLGTSDPDDDDVMIRFFGFVRALIHGPETGTLPVQPEIALEKLGLSTESESHFTKSLCAIYGCDFVPEELEAMKKWLPLLLQPAWHGHWSDPEVLDLCLRTVLEIRELDYTCVAETSLGYLVVAPVGAKCGDQLCLLNRSDSASILRDGGEYWEHVGRCYSFGLSDYRTKEFEKTMSKFQILELR
ncbi:Heterokaryon incompatibility [Akanthomyces lecanii RCEF 1005]|uniref:Heterokaryon incompatibility n=1 Tax=Akanthomyces lecanii RCEF 1005 TaxID=1081108 RepID=A0A168JFL3_CORDF|nr:Heterokaryon incompatibility [Akanthomyces lecanii RCEF 1005]